MGSPELKLDNQMGTYFHSLLAFSLYEAICRANLLPVPKGVVAPPVPGDDVIASITQKLISLHKEKPEVSLQGDELQVFYNVLDFVAKCMVSESDEELKHFVCDKFDKKGDGFDLVKKHYLAFSSAVIAELNNHGFGSA